MFTDAQLLALYQTLRDKHVLTVYIDESTGDPAMQHAWRLQLEHGLDQLEQRLAETRSAEFEAFGDCRRALESWLLGFDEAGHVQATAAFFTTRGLEAMLRLPVGTCTRAAWGKGAALGPLIGVRKQRADVVLAIADARHATLHPYRGGLLERVEHVRSHHPTAQTDHMGKPPHGGFHTGTRGRTARDAAQRAMRYGRDRMLSQATARILTLADPDRWILVAGTEPVASKLIARLNALAPGRVGRAAEIDAHSSEPEIAASAMHGALGLSAAFDLRRLAEIAEAAGARTLGVMGVDDLEWALDQACVRTLYVTPTYLSRHAAEADRAIRLAFEQSATVEQVFNEAATLLDERGGVAGALRFRPPASGDQSHGDAAGEATLSIA